MNVAEVVSAKVAARALWNRTGIQLLEGEKYLLEADGKWVDWFIPHGPEGDPSDSFYMRVFESYRRIKHENWFTLIGALNSDISTAFRIGAKCTYRAVSSGELTCFANDVEGFYWNNRGEVVIKVARIA